MRPQELEPLETQAEWRAGDVAASDEWTWELSETELGELEAALAHARARRDEVLQITREDFPLPTLGPRLARLEQELIDGRGFALLRGLPVERWGEADASMACWGIGMHLGRPWPQNRHGHLLGDVTDHGRTPGDPEARGYELGGVPLPYHSDGSDLVGLLCLRQARRGGTSTVANAVAVHNEMVRRRPDLAALLYEPMPYDYRGEEASGSRPFYFVPVFTRLGRRLFVRYIRPYIESAMRHPDAPRLPGAVREAFDMVDALTEDPDFNVYMDFRPGDMQFINNYHVLHGRTAYEDHPEPQRKRHLKRLWLETRRLRERPEHFRPRRSAQHWWARAAGGG